MFLPLPWFYESVLLFRGSNKTDCQINCSSFISNWWCFRLFPHSYWDIVPLYLMKTPVGLVLIWISHLNAIWALGVYGSIGRKYIKIHLELAFLFTLYIYSYIYSCTLFVFMCTFICNRTFRSSPECLSNVLFTFRTRTILRAGTYI